MIHHTKAVASGAKRAFVLADMPFMSYQQSVYDAVVSAGRLVKEARAQAVKLEGGAEFCPQIEAITQASIPVVAHLGLMPQSVNKIGGYRGQCREYGSAKKLVDDALAVQKAGAVALVLECVPADLAAFVTRILEIPTIGIGAGPGCDGQVLVYQDMLAMHDFRPKFVKVYENIGLSMKEAFERYIIDVKNSAFPSDEHFSSGGDSFELDVLPRLKSEYEVKKGGVACDDGGC